MPAADPRLASKAADGVGPPPAHVPQPVAENLWIVEGEPVHPAGLAMPTRMTVVRLGSGAMWLHSPTQYREPLRRVLEAEGPIRHLVAPNSVHWQFIQEWREHCPGAQVGAAPGLRRRLAVRRAGLVIDHELGPSAPPAWACDLDQAILPAAGGFREVAFFHRASRTLVLTDFIVNLEPRALPPWTRRSAGLLGMLAPEGRAGLHLRLATQVRRGEARAAAARLVAFRPERVIFAHGRWFERDAAARLERALAWLLD
jgi:hypothetical protein